MAGNTQTDLRQTVLRSALPMAGSAAGTTTDTILPLIDAELAKLFEDRNVLLTQGGTITFTGTQIQFTENLNLEVNSRVAGGSPVVISLGQATQTLNNLDMLVAVINRTAGTATVSVVTSATGLPAVTSANQEVFLIAKRNDAGDGTQRIYFRNGSALSAGQSVRLGASGSGSGGSGTGDDLDALQFRASFTDTFQENAANAVSSINGTAGNTNATFNAAKNMYVLSYDAAKTITTSGTTATISATPAYTVVAGDVVISGGNVRKITTVTSQTSYVLESAFPSNLTAASVTISQAVHTKDIYGAAIDGASLFTEFAGATFSEILVDYKDASASGSNVFVPNLTPLVGFVATNDLSNFTSVQKRATLITDTVGSTFLPSAGAALYLRFFSNATSGSGTVNLINYKAFLQKSPATAAGGVLNTAYAFTNSVGTPVNATLSVVGGKTRVLLSFQYAVGINSGSAYGSLDVYLNGQLLPRFVNSTLTPDGSFTEVSANIIDLDRDYSAQNLSLQIIQRNQIIDASTTNTTAISAQQEIMQNGFQGFVATNQVVNPTTTVGTPAAGTFYSTVQNRAPIIDPTQDLKPRMGIERFMVQQAVLLQTEFGPNGELVLGPANDTNLVRYVGQWSTFTNSNGQFLGTSTVGDYVEVTFYGTGLNILALLDGSVRDLRASVDGGAEGSNIHVTTSNILASRNYSMNCILNAASGLTPGIHTVKVRSAAGGMYLDGFEILNETTALKVNPGVAYTNGKKLAAAVTASLSYSSGFESGTLGTRGGRVLTYIKSDGTFGQAVQPVNAASATLTSTDHTNEEISRIYRVREFGATRSDDFSLSSGTGPFAFTLDDGTTSLATTLADISNNGLGDGIIPAATNAFWAITFVGTGLDIDNVRGAASASTYSVIVDGTTVASGLTTALSGTGTGNTIKIVSGLPYGTHTVKLLCTNLTGAGIRTGKFIVYQPKKPTLPSGAVELADYNVMATYAANTTAAVFNIGTGLLRKDISREMVLSGTWALGSINPSGNPGGLDLNSNVAGSYMQYTFFGTGFELRGAGNTSAAYSTSTSVTLNGLAATTANFPTLVSSTYGWAGFSAGVLNATTSSGATFGNGFTLSGLPLGTYTVRFTNNQALYVDFSNLDIITPIHSAKSNIYTDLQNTLPVGSCAISDNRKTTPLKDISTKKKNNSQAFGVTSGPTTTSATNIPCPDLQVVHANSTGKIKASYSLVTANLGNSNANYFQVFVDGLPYGVVKVYQAPAAGGFNGMVCDSFEIDVAPGTHTVAVYWYTNAGTASLLSTSRNLLVEEV